jgi:hypothetical protein
MFQTNRANAGFTLCLLLICCALPSIAQQIASVDRVVPLVNFSGTLSGADGKPLTGPHGLTFLLYKEETGGAPLWMETHNVHADKNGHYSVTLGSATTLGLPAGVFMAGEARWLGMRINGSEKQPRVLLLSVPYALKAGDAETLGGTPASAFMTAPASEAGSAQAPPLAEQLNEIVCSSGTACKTGFVPLFASNGGSAKVTDSIVTQNGGAVKIAGSETATGTIRSGGDLDASGNVNANGNVGASTVTTVALTGGVSSTMTGTGNSIAAVKGSATATGAAGFTFGVIGQSASDNGRGVFGLAPGAAGVGVIGETTGSSGVGVVGKTLNGAGWAFYGAGNALQDRANGGWAKALVSVEGASAPYKIVHCFNSTLPGSSATTPPCGFNLIESAYAQFHIDFGFEVDDRFWSVSAVPFFVNGNNGAIIADAWASAQAFGTNTILEVDMYTDGGDRQTTDFTVVVY